MKIDKFEEYKPKISKVSEYRKLINRSFSSQLDTYSGQKIVIVDDKVNYLTGPFTNKSRLLARMFWDIEQPADIHEPSMRRAIKDWIEDNSK